MFQQSTVPHQAKEAKAPLIAIANQIKDDETFKRLLVAARVWSPSLCLAINRVYWKSFTVSKQSMLDGWSADAQSGRNTAGIFDTPRRRDIARAITNLPSKYSAGPKYPVSLIESLTLNLQTGYSQGVDVSNLEDITWTLRTLFRHRSNATRISQFGSLFDANYQQLLSWASPTLRDVQIRALNYHGKSSKDLGRYSPGVDQLNLYQLTRFQLTHLDVSQVRVSEATGLAAAMRSWPNLTRFRFEAWKDEEDEHHSPLAVLLHGLRSGPHFKFPPALNELILIDNDFRGYPYTEEELCKKMGKRYVESIQLIGPSALTDIHLEVNDPEAATFIINALNASQMRHLTLSKLIDGTIFEKYERLESLTITNAWDALRVMDNFPDKSKAGLLQVRLTGTRARYKDNGKLVRNRRSNCLRDRLLGEMCLAPWGKHVQHMRLDNVQLGKLTLESFASPTYGLRNLKVLVIRPEPRGMQAQAIWTLRFTPYCENLLGHDTEDYPARRVAVTIAEFINKERLPRLRFLAIANHHFWIEHEPSERRVKLPVKELPGDDALDYTLWAYRDAIKDEGQRAIIRQVMHTRDWEFIGDESLVVCEDAPVDARKRNGTVTIGRDRTRWVDSSTMMTKVEDMMAKLNFKSTKLMHKRQRDEVDDEDEGDDDEDDDDEEDTPNRMAVAHRPPQQTKWLRR